ncbi:MAG: serine/threonine-protein kinase PknG [Streptosporangiales bacterium]|nr:serine/threonine-protein kinase PknG [Streptosporangiales bacterium]
MTDHELRCTRAGCDGTITDGYCDVCGLAPAPEPAPAAAAAAPAGGGADGGPTGSTHDPFGTSSGGSGGSGGTTGTRATHGSRGSRGSRGRRRNIGAGLVDIPPVAAGDPAAAVLAHAEVPENRRHCGHCEQPVGRPSGDRPGRTEGFCRNCGTRFSFTPKLRPGELVAGQYEVIGCLAHGGLCWIYLARDRRVSDMWVVLKGLLNTGDADAAEAARVERDALAEVRHPNIVTIHNFVDHSSPADGETTEYIVMDYVGGKSLKQIRLDARAAGGAVPLPHALAYMIEILPAFGYLHDHGLVYCDFKPDNVIQSEEQLKLIDLGGARRVDSDGAIYGTVGYQAPEIETEGPSPSSDLYTVGRALAVLTFEFPGYQREYKHKLPDSVPLLAEQPSFARALRKATHPDPAQRFQTAAEMAEQLTGVLREVLAAGDGDPRPAASGQFSPELKVVGAESGAEAPPAEDIITSLPTPLVDGNDPAAGYLATLAGLEPAAQADTLLAAVRGESGVPAEVSASTETRLSLVRALIMARKRGAADILASLAAEDPSDWRIAWYSGLLHLTLGSPAEARAAFDAVFGELPGELAPKLALAFAAEAAGDPAAARRYFGVVWTVDRSYISAAFGLARACAATGDRPGAVAALTAVPETSSQYSAAQIAAVRLLVAGGDGISADDLRHADGRLRRLRLDDLRQQQLSVEVLRAALNWVSGGSSPPNGPVILGCQPNERELRFGLERGYRMLASLTPDPARKVELVDMANDIRPRTWT